MVINIKGLKEKILKVDNKTFKNLKVSSASLLTERELMRELIFTSSFIKKALNDQGLDNLYNTVCDCIKSGKYPIFATKKFSYCFLNNEKINNLLEKSSIKKYQILNNILTDHNIIGSVTYSYEKTDSLGLSDTVEGESSLYFIDTLDLSTLDKSITRFIEGIPSTSLTLQNVKDLNNRLKAVVQNRIYEQLID